MISSIPVLAGLASIIGLSTACPDHVTTHALGRRADDAGNVTWSYLASYDWASLSEAFELCQTGTQQSPIPIDLNQGLSASHVPAFSDSYFQNVSGKWHNWGYGPALTLDHPKDEFTALPSFTFQESDGANETVYLSGFHIHAPADHSVQDDRSKAELHLVHVDAAGSPRSVLAIRIDPGNRNSNSEFFAQFPDPISFHDTKTRVDTTFNPSLALAEVNNFLEFFTYKGSLTSPPCGEGIRWYLARNIMFTSTKEMQDLLRVSMYSARAEQEVWLHEVNL